MKIRYLLLCFLFLVFCFSIYLLFDVKNKNIDLKKKYDEMSEIVRQNEIDKEIYFEKEQELDELKEKNSDKVKKYEEVLEWNQEIKSYLD